MKILITGASGQLGHELQTDLASMRTALGVLPRCYEGADVTAVDLGELDITDIAAVQQAAQQARFDLILNCAAFTNVDLCETEQDAAFRANALGARNLAMAAERIGAKLVHISTDYVFPGDGDRPYTEWDPTGPRSIYGKSKLLGEQYVREHCSRSFTLRTAWLYGPTGKNFVKTILRAGRERGSLTVVDDQRGNPTHVADLAHHMLKAAATQEYGLYHCTGGGICSWFDFACEIIRLAGIRCTISPCTSDQYPSPVKRPAYSALDHMMLRSTIGDAMRPWQQALACFIKENDSEVK